MFSGRKKKKRVEPRFETAGATRSVADFGVTDEDRAAPAERRSRGKAKAAASGGTGKASGRAAARSSPKAPARPRRTARSLIGGLFYWSFILAIWAGIGVAGIVAWYGAQLPAASTWAVPDRPPNVKIVANDGRLIANRGVTGGQALGLHEMSPWIPQAVIAIEDRRFFSHFGIDPKGLARAMAANLAAGSMVQGGSTLTQQLAKNLFLSADRTVGRKVQEVLLALWLEQKYSKAQILELYLNRVFFGSGAYGVEAASRRYFGKPARDVTLPEAALLAGLLKAPSRLSPARNPKAAEERAQVVLAAMRAQGMVSDTEMAAALSRPMTRAAAYWTGSEHYVADAVMEQLESLAGEIGQDVIVDTTIDMALQKAGEQVLRDSIAENGPKLDVSQAALVAVDATGAVRALVGGVDYSQSQFDRATEARRQPGSAFKPFVYATALEAGLTPETIRDDKPVRIGKWTPENYNGKYFGPVTLSEALARSLNSVAAQLITETGPKAVVEFAGRLGIASPLAANASLSLGTSEVSLLELTAAYTPFATGGWRSDAHLVTRVTTLDGKVLYEHLPEPRRVMAAQTAGMMNMMMSRVVDDGTAKAARFDHPAAGKTGTSQQSRDAWFIGYTANLTTGIWFGNDDNAPMRKVTGGSLPAQAWHKFMVAAHQGVPVAALPGYRAAPDAPVVTHLPDVALGRPVQGDGGFPDAPDPATTASTDRRDKTVLDILLGR